MDKILKVYFDTFRDAGSLPPSLSSLKGVTLFSDTNLLSAWRSNFKGIQWTDKKGNLFRGAVDHILQKGTKLIVLDYKTRGFPLKDDTAAHYQDQLDIYTLLLHKNGYATENYAYLLFYYPDKVLENGDVAFHTDLVKLKIDTKNAEKIFKKAVEVLEGKEPEAAKECEWCKWMNVKV
ncbi:PD-(D/E)XK nuclease family protein [archaeon]|nr:PD-(D/E)XK nuclease family protein [archaeon]